MRHGGLASSVADLALEFIVQIARSAGECSDDFEAGEAKFGRYNWEEEEY